VLLIQTTDLGRKITLEGVLVMVQTGYDFGAGLGWQS
jgi:hypothetical protein